MVVEDDVWQREWVVVLLEESEMGVLQCDSAEGALRILEKMGMTTNAQLMRYALRNRLID